MKPAKITLLASLGAGLEYYDLVIYTLLAKPISQQFFPSSNPTTALFATFAVFAIGYVVRPLGGVIFGVLGDRVGRKSIFANTLIWMALVTFIMGLVPNFSTLGLAATVIFSLCRVFQGLIFGAELPGAVTLLSEHLDPRKHGIHFGFMMAAVTLGVMLGSGVNWTLTKLLTEEQIFTWGFRVPFLLGGSLAIIGFFIRKNVPETPIFLNRQKSTLKWSWKIIKNHLAQVLTVLGILLFPSSLVTLQLVFPVYLHDYYHFEFSNIYLALTCGYLWCVVILIIFGWISDQIGRKALIIFSAILLIIFLFPMFNLLKLGSSWTLFSFFIFLQTIIGIMTASYLVLLPQAFQTIIRYTGTAFSYNIAYTITAFLPVAINYVFEILKKPELLVWILILLAVLAIICASLLKSKTD